MSALLDFLVSEGYSVNELKEMTLRQLDLYSSAAASRKRAQARADIKF